MNAVKHRIEGVVLLLTLIGLFVGLFGHWVGDDNQALAVNLRILDNLRPHVLGVTLIGAVTLAVLGMRRVAGLAVLCVVIGSVWMVVDHRARVAPALPEGGETLRVLWFNMLHENGTPTEELVQALRASDADLIVLAEATPMAGILPKFADLYPHRAGCTGVDRCQLAILSRYPIGPLSFEGSAFGPERLARFPLKLPGGAHPMIVAVHRIKPWYLGLTDAGDEWVDAVLGGPRARPLIMMGDFNATPWSRRMTTLQRDHDLSHVRWPIATWPTRAGGFGLPIDHVLLRGPVGFDDIAPWGSELGSNHRGLLADLRVGPNS